ncbi:TetR/AcrR family transcriptional regulator [Thalassomonas viridans]|uniref:TetR/AcrR family transcriptional regulator n=1 Tax=Thalassomonas viridans TaxID=137584 RepID=A0AAE9Z8S9_9GAMM|nr:TetR/AcrR family transcriptional regulator [Thalassomonas viridans]WDE08860.1 TetR/AcrR family transcriptional regulator [Thalassomonas viridans]
MSRRDEILKVAESRVRTGGYNNVSHREIAAEVGIKSASVHYHFKTKEDLGAELAHQYTNSFLNTLGEPGDIISRSENPITKYIELFRAALIKDKKMCLCGLLGAESDCLPDKVRFEIKRFFELNIEWLKQSYVLMNPQSSGEAKVKAIKLISMLEGALMISKAMDNIELFDQATLDLVEQIQI